MKKVKLIWISTTVALLALLYFFIDARHSSFFPGCPFHHLTGLFCPGCGSQRAVSSLLHGDLSQALSYNILLVGALPLIVYSAFVHVYNALSDRQVNQAIFYSPLFARVFLVVVLLFAVARNIPAYPFKLLAPH